MNRKRADKIFMTIILILVIIMSMHSVIFTGLYVFNIIGDIALIHNIEVMFILITITTILSFIYQILKDMDIL